MDIDTSTRSARRDTSIAGVFELIPLKSAGSSGDLARKCLFSRDACRNARDFAETPGGKKDFADWPAVARRFEDFYVKSEPKCPRAFVFFCSFARDVADLPVPSPICPGKKTFLAHPRNSPEKKSALIFRPICPDFPPCSKSAQICPPSASNISVQIVLVTNLPGKPHLPGFCHRLG